MWATHSFHGTLVAGGAAGAAVARHAGRAGLHNIVAAGLRGKGSRKQVGASERCRTPDGNSSVSNQQRCMSDIHAQSSKLHDIVLNIESFQFNSINSIQFNTAHRRAALPGRRDVGGELHDILIDPTCIWQFRRTVVPHFLVAGASAATVTHLMPEHASFAEQQYCKAQHNTH